MAFVIDKEYAIFQRLVTVPDEFEEGFGVKTIVAAIFLGFLMVPASMYLEFFLGQGGLGGASQWVTLILFSEVAKRSMKSLRKQEIFVLFYMTGIVMSSPGSLLWNQYFVRSPAAIAFGIAPLIPAWVAPQKEVLDQYGRTFLTKPWLTPIMFMIGMHVLGRIDRFGLGYALYRWTSHVEKLPFPMAPQGALGITALADTHDNSQRWRWRCFSLGTVLGLGWGTIYIGVPALTGAILKHQIQIIPIPWLDLTPAVSTKDFLPAVPFHLVFDMGGVLIGMFLPFWAVMGTILGVLSTLIVNPMLHSAGMLPSWHPGLGYIETEFGNRLDFYLSWSIGVALSIFITAVAPLLRPLLRWLLSGLDKLSLGPSRQVLEDLEAQERWSPRRLSRTLIERNRQRGDISILISLFIYVALALTYIGICMRIMPGTAALGYRDRFPWVFFLIFAFVYTPCMSYVHAKMTGMLGIFPPLPMVREATLILSGYRGAAIWFAPIPASDYGGAVTEFRILELTGTRLSGVVKADVLAFPILMITTVLFSQVMWRMAPIPSQTFPATEQLWNQRALRDSLTFSATLDPSSPFIESLKPKVIGWGLGVGVVGYIIVRFLSLPILAFYGLITGMGAGPGGVIAVAIGAFCRKFYFERRYDTETFKRYIMIVSAGFGAGVGLIGMGAAALAMIKGSTTTLGY